MKSYRSGVLFHNPDKTFDGFTTVAPIRHTASYLINMEGHIVHTWKLPGPLGTKGYIIPNGNFLGSAVTQEGAPIKAAKGGHIFELDWDGNIVWEHIDHNQHHDIRRLENGNTVYLAWEELNQHDVDRVLGGIPGTEKDGKIYGDVIREINFYGDIVWEWKTSDIDFNAFPLAHDCDRSEWAHANAVAPTLDGNILVSFRHLDTIMIIDRKTKKIIWHKRSQEWGHQHDCEMLPNGNIILFANGMNNLKQPLHSRVLEINHATGETIWQFKDPRQWSFFSPIMGGVQRLDNTNTLICEALNGRIFEVTSDGEIVWDYIAPMFHDNPIFEAESNAMFRAYRHRAGSPEISRRV